MAKEGKKNAANKRAKPKNIGNKDPLEEVADKIFLDLGPEIFVIIGDFVGTNDERHVYFDLESWS